VGERNREKLEKLRCFGLLPLLTNSFKLIGHDRFEAQSIDGNVIKGRILSVVDNHPIALTYTIDENKDDVFLIKYAYRPDEQLPNYFEHSLSRRGRNYGSPYTNWIEHIEYGTIENIQNGYEPSMFYSNLATFSVTIWSNGVRYALNQEGKRTAVSSYIPEYPDVRRKKSWPAISFIFLFVSGLFICGYYATKKNETDNKKR
jgi:uncharacterized protein YndB with AHSA1/START domain